MPEELNNQPSNQPPTWADFKPPVSTTPFSTNPTPAPPPLPEPPVVPAATEPIVHAEETLDASPMPSPGVSGPDTLDKLINETILPNPAPEPPPAPMAATPAEEATSAHYSGPQQGAPAPSFTPTPVPQPPVQPMPVVDPSIQPVAPETILSPEPAPLPVPLPPVEPLLPPNPMPAPMSPPEPLAESLDSFKPVPELPSIPQVPEETTPPFGVVEPSGVNLGAPAVPSLGSTAVSTPPDPFNLGPSPIPAAAPPPPAQPVTPSVEPVKNERGGSVVPWIAGAVVLVGLLIAAGFYFYTNQLAKPAAKSSTLGAQTSASTILASSLGPDSWQNNYSNSLQSIERGGLEFMVTDPAPTPSKITLAATPAAQTRPGAVKLSSLTVNVAKVDVHLTTQSTQATGLGSSSTKSANLSSDHWETLRLNDNTSVDLMDLRSKGGILDSLGVTYLVAGHYLEMRVYITSAVATLADGTRVSLNLDEQNGVVKIIKPFDLSASGTAKVVVDFDAPSSVTQSGTGYIFTPVVANFIINGQKL